MNLNQRLNILQNFPLFQTLPAPHLHQLARTSQPTTFASGQMLLEPGQPASSVHLIHHGLISIYILSPTGRILPIRTRGPFYIVGELNLFDQESTAIVEALIETHTLALGPRLLQHYARTQPAFALNLLQTITEKLRAANRHTEQLSLTLHQRVWLTLTSLAPQFPNRQIPISQEQLANLVGASRARVSQILTQLQQRHQLTLHRRKITLS